MPESGPTYCETLTATFPASFPIEPVNALTSLLPALAGILGFTIAYRNGWLTPAVGALSAFAVSVGIGSMLWHGLRTPLTLALDVIPGLLFFITFVFLWPAMLFNRWVAYATFSGFFVLQIAAFMLFEPVGSNGPPITLFFVTALVGAVLLYFTFKRKGAYGWIGLAILVFGALAATARTFDLELCGVVPFGTHFLWHTFLGGAAFLAIYFTGLLENQRRVSL